MTSNQIVLRVVDALEQANIPYMITGSYSSNAFGIARSTQDADFVIESADRSITPLFQLLAPDVQFDPQMRLESVTMSMRWVGTHAASGFKVELFSVTDDPHDRERFARRKQRPFLDRSAWLPTPEDVIIQKLRWFERARRAKDHDDAVNVLAVKKGSLDMDYIGKWVDQHGTRVLLDQWLNEIARISPETGGDSHV